MEKITYHDIKNTFPEEKKTVEAIYGRIIPVRKLSYIVTIPFLKLNVSAFQVSILSILCSVLAAVFIASPNRFLTIIGVILVPIWHLLDCVDGNIARYKKTSSFYGEAVDAISGYYMYAFLPIALGIASYNVDSSYFGLDKHTFLILGGLASISNLLMRLIHQKYAFVSQKQEQKTGMHIDKGDEQYHLTGFHKFRKMVGVELGPVGAPMFVLWIAPFFDLYYLLTIYYFLFFTSSLIVVTIYYLKKCNMVDRQ